MSRTCVASVLVKLSSTKTVAPAGGQAAEQSPIGWHAVWPRTSIVAPVHGVAGRTSTHPQPDGSGAKPAAHAAGPTGWHELWPRTGIVPAGQAADGVVSRQPHPD